MKIVILMITCLLIISFNDIKTNSIKVKIGQKEDKFYINDSWFIDAFQNDTDFLVYTGLNIVASNDRNDTIIVDIADKIYLHKSKQSYLLRDTTNLYSGVLKLNQPLQGVLFYISRDNILYKSNYCENISGKIILDKFKITKKDTLVSGIFYGKLCSEDKKLTKNIKGRFKKIKTTKDEILIHLFKK